MLQHLDRWAGWVQRISIAIASTGFVVVTGAFLWTVLCRYLLGSPSTIGEELAITVYLWVVMIGASLAIDLKDHVAFDLLTALLPPRVSAAAVALGALICGALLAITLPQTVDYIAFLWREKTPVMRIPLNWLYLCFAVMQASIALKLLVLGLHSTRAAITGRIGQTP